MAARRGQDPCCSSSPNSPRRLIPTGFAPLPMSLPATVGHPGQRSRGPPARGAPHRHRRAPPHVRGRLARRAGRRAGCAHLFEHLMFEGSAHVPVEQVRRVADARRRRQQRLHERRRDRVPHDLPVGRARSARCSSSPTASAFLDAGLDAGEPREPAEGRAPGAGRGLRRAERARRDSIGRLFCAADHPYHHPVIGTVADIEGFALDGTRGVLGRALPHAERGPGARRQLRHRGGRSSGSATGSPTCPTRRRSTRPAHRRAGPVRRDGARAGRGRRGGAHRLPRVGDGPGRAPRRAGARRARAGAVERAAAPGSTTRCTTTSNAPRARSPRSRCCNDLGGAVRGHRVDADRTLAEARDSASTSRSRRS